MTNRPGAETDSKTATLDESLSGGSPDPADPPQESSSQSVLDHSETKPHVEFPVVGLGASAGGIEPLSTFFSAVPADSGMAFIVVQHIDPTRESQMASILARHTSMPVKEVEDGILVEVNHVYTICPDRELKLEEGRIRLSPFTEKRGLRRPIDSFFRSLALDAKQRAIAVVLSGTGGNGSEGIKAIKAEGGLVLAQAPETAQFSDMPRNTIRTGLVDLVLPPVKMPQAILGYTSHPYVREGKARAGEEAEWRLLNDLLALVHASNKHDFRAYKKPMILRRIARRMGILQIEEMSAYLEYLRSNQAEVQALTKDLLINVTNFFRDPEAWVALERDILAPLIREKGANTTLRAWVTACSTGEEAYTLAMVMVEQLEAAQKNCPIKIFATDPFVDGLTSARTGVFPESIEADLSPERLKRFFEKQDSHYQIKKEIRELVVFAPQNLLSDSPFSRLDLITCRNMLMYLEPATQQKILGLFHFSLSDGGFLFLGSAETLGRQVDLFVPVSQRWRIFRKTGRTQHERVQFPVFQGELPPGDSPPLTPLERRNRPASAELAQQFLVNLYGPPSVLIDERLQCLHFFGNTEKYLSQPAGPSTRDLRLLIRESLLGRLRSAIKQAQTEHRRITTKVQLANEDRGATIAVTPIQRGREGENLILVSFLDEQAGPPETPESDAAIPPDSRRDGHFEDELRLAREDLQSSVEELELSNEELKASHEEVTSTNEELQSTNEELETAKEELQSLNEELTTVNHQLEIKIEEAETTANDLNNLLTSTDIATLFLDREFRIRRYTPTVQRLTRIIQGDVGRSLSELALPRLDPSLEADAERVLDRLTTIEKEILTDDGHWYLRRVLPYRTEDNRISGVVVTYDEFTRRKQAEDQLKELNQTLEDRVGRAVQIMQILKDAAAIANDADTIDGALRRSLDRVREELDWPICHAWVATPDDPAIFTSSVWSLAAPGAYGEFVKATVPLRYSAESACQIGQVIRTARPSWDGKVERVLDTERGRMLADAGIESVMAFPIVAERDVVGVLEFFGNAQSEPDPLFLDGMTQFGVQLGRVFERQRAARELARLAEQQRREVAYALHEGVAQQLAALALLAGVRQTELGTKAGPGVDQFERIARDAQSEVVRLAQGLAPVQLGTNGLMFSLEKLCEKFAESSGILVRFECPKAIHVDDSLIAIELYQIAKEAIQNATKHAKANEVVVSLVEISNSELEREIELTVADNGSGFELVTGSRGLGVRMMHNRAATIGADLQMQSGLDKGTKVICRVRVGNRDASGHS